MPKIVCGKCQVSLRPLENGVVVAEMFQQNTKLYKLWSADLWECPKCNHTVVAGFACNPSAEHYKDDCEEIVRKLKTERGRTVIYDKEILHNET